MSAGHYCSPLRMIVSGAACAFCTGEHSEAELERERSRQRNGGAPPHYALSRYRRLSKALVRFR